MKSRADSTFSLDLHNKSRLRRPPASAHSWSRSARTRINTAHREHRNNRLHHLCVTRLWTPRTPLTNQYLQPREFH
jgi:hypothetical protein